MLQRLLLWAFLISISTIAFGQAPPLQWQYNFGGSAADSSLQACENKFGDIYLSGFSYSTDQNMAVNAGSADIWLSKINKSGTLLWSKTFGGTQRDRVIDLVSAQDGGAVMLCNTESINGTFDNALTGMWLVKTDVNGVIVWKKPFGGSSQKVGSLIATSDGGYLFSCSLTGTVGTLTASGPSDIRIVKVNSLGDLLWQQKLGGTSSESPGGLAEYNNEYFVLGSSSSISVNSQNNQGGEDVLLAKYNSSGTIQLTKMYGGSGNDKGVQIRNVGTNKMFVLASTNSIDGDVLGFVQATDAWFFEIDAGGTLIFGNDNYVLGGPADDIPSSFFFDTALEVPVFTTSTYSTFNASDPVVPNIYVAKAIVFGDTSWERVLGGSGQDLAGDILYLSDGGILVSGQSTSNSGSLTGNFGASDFWVFKLKDPCPSFLTIDGAPITSTFSRTAGSSIQSNMVINATGSYIDFNANAIFLQPGFEVKAGTIFTATPQGCN